jgi:8-amino-7-oxononanoate synthase
VVSFDKLKQELEQRRAEYLYRTRRIVESPQGPEITIDGKRYLAFCSNDYLGLANHPAVVAALKEGADLYGAGSGAAHLVSGHSLAHHVLEEELAEFTGRPRALLFSTGYMANLGVISALLQKGDAVFEDRLNHASLLDGGLLSGARLQRYPHGDVTALSERFSTSRAQNKLIVTDGVFSMDGDIAPIAKLAAAAQHHGAGLMIDDAHGFGVLGEHGRGTLEHLGINTESVPILMCTLGKALGTFGAFVAGSEELIETLIQKARSYIYTTALPPAIAHATRTGLRLVREESWRRAYLNDLVNRFRQSARQLGLPIMPSQTAIQPLLIGDAHAALEASEKLQQRGILISAIRPPTVPQGSARLRITFSAAHSEQQVDRLLETLQEILS